MWKGMFRTHRSSLDFQLGMRVQVKHPLSTWMTNGRLKLVYAHYVATMVLLLTSAFVGGRLTRDWWRWGRRRGTNIAVMSFFKITSGVERYILRY